MCGDGGKGRMKKVDRGYAHTALGVESIYGASPSNLYLSMLVGFFLVLS